MGRFAFGKRRLNMGGMHLNNGGTNRPSLLSGGARTKRASPPASRILADMEGRPVTGAVRARRAPGTQSRVWLWLAPLLLIATVLLTLTASRFSVGRTAKESTGYSPPPATSITPAIVSDATPAPGGAVIIDATADARPLTPVPDALAAIGDGDTADAAATIARAAASTAGAATAATPQGAARRPAAGTTAARDTRDKAKGDEGLLGTLMGIIRRDEQPEPKATPAPDSMDALIAQIQADNRKQAADTDDVFNHISGRSPTGSSRLDIQTRLEGCGSATTAAGLSCRKKICAAVAGKQLTCQAM
jgi:hypothetical protein